MDHPVSRHESCAVPSWLTSSQTLAVALAAIGMFAVYSWVTLEDVDLFWQVRLGEMMLERRELIRHDSFTYTHAGQPAPTPGWLGQLLFAFAYRAGDWPAVQIAHLLLFVGGFTIAALSVRQGVAGPLCIALAMVFAFRTVVAHSPTRPQSFAVAGFALLLALARSDWTLKWKCAGALPILVVWQNAHPSLTVGGAALAALAAAEWITWWRTGKIGLAWHYLVLGMFLAAAQFATPMGFSILPLLRENQRICTQLNISEWRQPWDPTVFYWTWPYWTLTAVSIVLLLRLRKRVAFDDFCLFVAMTLLPLTAGRMTLFWALAMLPLWARWLEQTKPEDFLRIAPRCSPWLWLIPAALLPAVLLLPYLRPQLFSDEIPMAGIKRLDKELPEGRVYNYREWGGPLIFEGRGRWRVAIDGRLYYFSDEEWTRYAQAALGELPLEDIVRYHDPDAFFLRPSHDGKLIEELRRAPDWRDVHTDENSSVFVRATPRLQPPKVE